DGIRDFHVTGVQTCALPIYQAVDVAIVDVIWNGAWQSMKIASLADIHEVNVAPHNFYGHLCTMMNAHFACAVPNFRIMETDVDRSEERRVGEMLGLWCSRCA